MGQHKSEICRFCKQPGALVKGAHRECKNEDYKNKVRIKRCIAPERWTAADGKKTCNTCHTRPRNGKSYQCVQCKIERIKETKRISHNLYMRRRRAKIAMAERPCKCGCGRPVTGYRKVYAVPECRPQRVAVVKVKKELAPKMRHPVKRMPDGWLKPAPVAAEAVVIATVVEIRRIPSVLPSTLRDPATGTFWP